MTFPRRHPYITATIAACLLAVMVWLLVPKEYAAYTKLSDEHKEMDIAIGLDRKMSKRLQRDKGMNNMEVYSKVLETEDFARKISHKQVPQKGKTYGEYIGRRDTIKAVLSRINYNYSDRHKTLTITCTDSDPLVAYQMLDSITMQLQAVIAEKQCQLTATALEDAMRKRDNALKQYQKAQARYAAFADTHRDPDVLTEQQEIFMLQKEVQLARQYYDKAVETSVRQQILLHRPYVSFAVVKENAVPKTPKGTIWSYLICFTFISLVLTSWVRQYQRNTVSWRNLDSGNLFAPWNITILLWVTILVCIYLLGDQLYPLTSQFYIAISLWISIFCISSFITCQLGHHPNGNQEYINKPLHLNRTFFYLLLVVSLVFTPLCVKAVMDVIRAFGTNNIMQSIRMIAVKGGGFGILDLSFVINKVLLIVALWRYPQISVKTIILIGFLTLLNSFAVMDKGTIFFIITTLLFVLYERRLMTVIHIAIGAICVVSLFFMLTVMRDEGGENGNMDLSFFLGEYIFANPVAFGYLPHSVSPQFGANTLYLVYYYLQRFGIGDYMVTDIVQEFSYVPIRTNLYTVMQPFFVDFGYLGIASFAFVYGVGIGWCYGLYKNGNATAKCIYTYLIMILVMQFGQEAIFLRPVEFLRACFLLYILTQSRFRLCIK